MEEWQKSVLFWLAFYAIIIVVGIALKWTLATYFTPDPYVHIENVSGLFNESVMNR
jgi:hypothetical protein